MAYLSCPSCGLSVHRRPHDIIDTKCPRCGQPAVESDRAGPDFCCDVRRENGGAIVEIGGELDGWTARLLDARMEGLRADGIASLVVDLRKLSFIDSSGLAALVDWTRRARRESFSFELIDGSPPVDRVIDLCGLREVFAFREPAQPEPYANG